MSSQGSSRFFHPQKQFAINSRAKIDVQYVGDEKHQVLTIDGFYKDPKFVRRLFRQCPAAIWKDVPGTRNFKDYYDCRHTFEFSFGMEPLTDFLSQLIGHYYDQEVRYPNIFTSNVFQLIKSQPKDTTAFPHTDHKPEKSQSQSFNVLVNLNLKSECRGGTALYRHIETQKESTPLKMREYLQFKKKYIENKDNFESGKNYWCRYKKNWEPFHLLEMKFNRLVVFPSEIFHGAWHQPDWFKNYPRITQVFFAD